jgi:hypothetical protein
MLDISVLDIMGLIVKFAVAVGLLFLGAAVIYLLCRSAKDALLASSDRALERACKMAEFSDRALERAHQNGDRPGLG